MPPVDSGAFLFEGGRGISVLNSEDDMETLNPCIWKPVPLWTGKQVISLDCVINTC